MVLKAHRISYFLNNAGICLDLKVLHKCDNPSCVNPAHLFQGTQADNVHDMCSKGRNRCIPLSGENNPMSKLTFDKVKEIRTLYAHGDISQAALGKLFSVGAMTINRIVNNQLWIDI